MATVPLKSQAGKPNPSALAEKLGHIFATPRLLEEALTHPSLAGFRQRKKGAMPYERMEFLGDRVLGLAIAEWLYETFPNADEGEMAKRHAALVNREALRVVAQEIGLGAFVRLARGEEAGAEGRKNLATLPDAMEAVIGALYLDGGFAARVILSTVTGKARLRSAKRPPIRKQPYRNGRRVKGCRCLPIKFWNISAPRMRRNF